MDLWNGYKLKGVAYMCTKEAYEIIDNCYEKFLQAKESIEL